MPTKWRSVLATVATASFFAVVLSTVMTAGAVVMLAPLVMLFRLNNEGLRESVKVSKSIFLINLLVMGITICMGLVYLIMHGANMDGFVNGATLSPEMVAEHHEQSGHGSVSVLPGLAMLSMPMLLAGAGSSILGASGVESVMNIPEELARPREDVRRIYRWMLSLLLLIGGATSLLLFTVLPPDVLASKSNYLLAALGDHVMAGVTGSSHFGQIWQSVIVATAALMLIGATNTGFAGARGLWLTMARDNLLPTSVLKPNLKGAYERAHWVMLLAIFGLAMQADWSLPKLERWYGATFGLVMFSGMVAFVLLRKYRSGDARAYTAPWNVGIFGMRLPVGAIIGFVALGYALLSMYSTYRGDIGELRTLVLLVSAGVGVVLLLFNHRTIIRRVYGYFRRVVDTVESTAIETEDRTAVVAVGEVRYRRILDYAFKTARAQGIASGRPYRQIVAFHMTPDVTRETIYEVVADGVRPAGIPAAIVRIYSDLSRMSVPGIRCYLVLMPPNEGYDERRGDRKANARPFDD
ncbi:MAG: APC family permease, partial [Nannocystaceae bacterium]